MAAHTCNPRAGEGGLVGTWASLDHLVNSRPVTDPDSKNKGQHLRKKLEAELGLPRKHVCVHISVCACTYTQAYYSGYQLDTCHLSDPGLVLL